MRKFKMSPTNLLMEHYEIYEAAYPAARLFLRVKTIYARIHRMDTMGLYVTMEPST